MTEGIANMLGGLLGGGGSGSGSLESKIIPALLKVAQSQGGIEALLAKVGASNSPIAGQLSSWIGTGTNQSVTPDQTEQAIGTDTVAQVAQQAGVSHDEAKSGLASALPGLIDKISPGGQLPDLGALSGALGKLLGH
jgi:uncharacterized protein YidB (DUF937 family)